METVWRLKIFTSKEILKFLTTAGVSNTRLVKFLMLVEACQHIKLKKQPANVLHESEDDSTIINELKDVRGYCEVWENNMLVEGFSQKEWKSIEID